MRDSAGVEIIEVPQSAIDALPILRLSAAPSVSIGEVFGDEPYLFASVPAATILGDGRVVLAEGRAREIRIFSEDGVFLSRFGARGEGPGSFEQLTLLGALGDTALAAWDGRQQRATVFGLDGRILDEWQTLGCPNTSPVAMVAGCVAPPVGFLGDGGFVVVSASRFSLTGHDIAAGMPLAGATPEGTVQLGILDPSGFTLAAALPQARQFIFRSERDGRGLWTPRDRAYGGRPVWAVGSGVFAYGFTAGADVHVRGRADRPHRIIRFSSPPTPVGPEHMAPFRAGDWGGDAAAIDEWLEEFGPAETVPRYGDLMLATDDRIWVQDYYSREITPDTLPRWWTVFTPAGVPEGRVELPPVSVARVRAVAPQGVLLLARDSLDVLRLDLHPLLPLTGS